MDTMENGVNLKIELKTKWWNLPLGIFLFLVPTFSYIFTSILWFWDVPMQTWCLLAGVMGAFSFIFGFRTPLHLRKVEILYIVLSFFALLGVGVSCASYVYDYAYDGMLYHQPMIYSLMNGWNPFSDIHSPFFIGETFSSYVDNYPKAIETMAAVFSLFFKDLEVGKVVNWLFLSSSFCLSAYFLTNYLCERVSCWKILLLSFLLSGSPVTLAQLFTFYVDWSLYYVILALAVMVYDLSYQRTFSRRLVDYIVICTLIAVAASTKLTVMFWATVFLIVMAVVLLSLKLLKNPFPLFCSSFLGGCIGIFFLSYNPYVTNILEGRNLFYPFIGQDAVDVYAIQAPALEQCNRVEAVFTSLTSRPSIGDTYNSPFEITAESVVNSGKADTRLGGYGLFFLEVLVSGLIIFILSYKKNNRDSKLIVAVLLFLLGSLFILPNGWWARFTPFFYFFPLLCLIYAIKYGHPRFQWLNHMVVALMLLNIVILQGTAVGLMAMHRSKVDYLVDVLRVSSQPVKIDTSNFGFKYKLAQHGIPTVDSDSLRDILIFPGSRILIDAKEWRVDLVDKNQYFLLNYSNIKDGITKCISD